MKRIIATITCLVSLTNAHYHSEFLKADSLTEEFGKFLTQHGKKYDSFEEFKFREQIFRENFVNMVEGDINANVSHKYSPFMDMTTSEFAKTHFGFNYDPEAEALLETNSSEIEFITNLDEEIPTYFNWAEKGAVTPIKDQGQCGSCWAFSSTGAIEGQTFLQNGKLVSVSEQELVDCDTVDHGCNGGLMENAFEQLISIGGIEKEEDYAYKAVKEQCALDKKKIAVKVTGYNRVKANSQVILETLFKKGPLAVALNASHLQTYTGGIYKPRVCLPMINHAVLLVGFGEETDQNGKVEKYWIVKNSWGENWGEKGYFRISRKDKKNSGTCGIQTHVISVDIAQDA